MLTQSGPESIISSRHCLNTRRFGFSSSERRPTSLPTTTTVKPTKPPRKASRKPLQSLSPPTTPLMYWITTKAPVLVSIFDINKGNISTMWNRNKARGDLLRVFRYRRWISATNECPAVKNRPVTSQTSDSSVYKIFVAE